MNKTSNKKEDTKPSSKTSETSKPQSKESDTPNPINDELMKIHNEQIKEIYDEEMREELEPIIDEELQEIYNEIIQDELNAIIMDDISNEMNPYLSQVVSEAKELKLDQEIVKEFRSSKVNKTTRTTFSLANRTMQILSKLEKQYDYSPRMVFQEAAQLPIPANFSSDQLVEHLNEDNKRTRKTYVIDSQTLQTFNDNASKFDISRDQIVDAHVAALYHLLVEANQAEMNTAAEYRKLANGLDGKLMEIANKAKSDFGTSDHPVVIGFSEAAVRLMNISSAIDAFLSSGIWEE